MNRTATNVLIALISTVSCLFVSEFAARRLVPEVDDTFIVKLKSFDEKYHHGSHTLAVVQPDMTRYRIMFVGDSFTRGMCPAEKSFPYLVESYFNTQAVPDVPKQSVQILNLGVPSHSPSVYGAVIRDFAPQFKPNLIVLGVDDSDPQDDYIYRNMVKLDSDGLPISVYPALSNVPPQLARLVRTSKILRLFFAARPQRTDEEGSDSYLAQWENRLGHYFPEEEEQQHWKSAFERTLGLMDAIVRYCRQNDIKVVILNYPYPPAVTTRYSREWRHNLRMDPDKLYTPSFHAREREFAEARNVPYYDFTDYLRRLDDHQGLYNESDGHFSGEGNEHLARELVRFIYSNVILKK